MNANKITILLSEPNLAPSIIEESEIRGSLKLSILTDMGEIYAPYYYQISPSYLEEALKELIEYLQNFLDTPLDDTLGLEGEDFYENIPGAIDQIGQIFHYIQNPEILTKYKELYEKTLQKLNERFSKDFDGEEIPTWDSEMIQTYIEIANQS